MTVSHSSQNAKTPLRQGVIAELIINDGVRLTFEYEGDLTELFKRIDDTFEAYRKVMEYRYPYEPFIRRKLRSLKLFLVPDSR